LRGFFGGIFIIIIYTIFGIIFDSGPFYEFSTYIVIIYSILLLLLIVNGAYINKFGIKALLLWMFLSVIPGSAFILYARYSESTGGLIAFPWDWGLWEIFLPVIVGGIQIIYFLAYLSLLGQKKI